MGWGQVIGLLLSLISIKLTTAIGPSEYGHFILVTSLGGLLTLSLFGPMEQGFVRYYFEFSKNDAHRAAYLFMVETVMKKAAAYLGIAAVAGTIAGVMMYGESVMFMVSASLLIIITVIAAPFNGLFNAMKLRKEVSIIQVLEKGLIVIILFAVSRFIPMDAGIVMSCVVGAMLVFIVVRVVLYHRQIGQTPSEDERRDIRIDAWKKIVTYGWPFIIWGWLSWLQFNGERWVINSYLTTVDVGKYGLSASIVNNSIVMVYGVLIQFMTPSIYGKFASENRTERMNGYSLIRITSAATFILFLLFGVFLYFAGSMVIQLLSTKEYIIDTTILLLLTVGLGLFYVGQTLAMVGFAMEKPEAYLVPKVLSSVVSVAGYIAGCLWFGLYGIVFAVIIGNSFYLISIIIINKRNFTLRMQ
jgi:O-antigen/teichoic acid export membrane protein